MFIVVSFRSSKKRGSKCWEEVHARGAVSRILGGGTSATSLLRRGGAEELLRDFHFVTRHELTGAPKLRTLAPKK
jgi:hypothetical protein